MTSNLMSKYGIKQICYYVEDLEKAALEHSAFFGSGPFFYMDPITLSDGTQNKVHYNDQEVEITKQMAYGQFGNLQIELVQVISEGPDPYKSLGHYGLHHFSIWSDVPEAAVKMFTDSGYKIALQFVSGAGMVVTFIDCLDPWGHYVEIHQPVEGFWKMVKQASENWDGMDPYRKLGA